MLILSSHVFGHVSLVKEQVKLATGEGYSPYVDSDLPDGGWSTSLIKQTFDKLNLAASIDILPWGRALKWTQETKFLGAFPFVYSEQRAQHFLFSTAINYVPVHMYVASNANFSKPIDLKHKRLCFPLGYSLGAEEQGIIDRFEMTINRVKDGQGCVKHVQKGWSDAGLTNGYMHADKFIKDPSLDNPIVIFPEQLAQVPLHLVISKNNINAQKWIEQFNHAFLLLSQSGEKSATDDHFIKLLKDS